MNKNVSAIVYIVFISVFVTSCGVSKENSIKPATTMESTTSNASSANGTTGAASETNETATQSNDATGANTGTNKSGSEPNAVEPLEVKDFTVTDGKNVITLDTPYKDFKMDEEEKETDNSYVGETISGEFTYKNYMHQYKDFDIYVSNAYHNTKNRHVDEYYITQITLNTPAYKTARGIAVGAELDDVEGMYGEGRKVEDYENLSLVYGLNEMELSFDIDENQKVQTITLNIVVE